MSVVSRVFTLMVFLSQIVPAAAFGNSSDAVPKLNWDYSLSQNCSRCTSAARLRKTAPVPISERAVVYSFTGEFASNVTWWLINLNTGEVTKWDAMLGNAGKQAATTSDLGLVDTAMLERLRASAAKLWRSKPPRELSMIPGSDEEDYVVSGSRMVSFNRHAPKDHYIAAAIEASLPVDAVATGSFFVPGHH